jgi:hypothetical protein
MLGWGDGCARRYLLKFNHCPSKSVHSRVAGSLCPISTIVCPMSFTQKCWLVFYKAKMERGPSHIIGLVVYLTSLKNSANQSDPLEKKKKWKKNIELWDALTTNEYKLCIIYLPLDYPPNPRPLSLKITIENLVLPRVVFILRTSLKIEQVETRDVDEQWFLFIQNTFHWKSRATCNLLHAWG